MSNGFRSLLLSSSSHIFLPSKTFLGATIRAGATFQEHQAFQEQAWPRSRESQQRDPGLSLSDLMGSFSL